MHRRGFSGMLILLILSTWTFHVQPVKASSTIYIRANGSIDPSDAPISSSDNVTYIFTGNINGSIVVERDNIAIDGANHTLQGSGSGTGIDLSSRSNVAIRNAEIRSFGYGVLVYDSDYNTVSGNKMTNNEYGILLWESSSYNTISGNAVAKSEQFAILLYSTPSYNTVSGNNITKNQNGIYLDGSSENTLRSNDVSNNGENFCVVGKELSHFIQDIDDSNTVSGKPVYYWVNRRDMAVPLDAGYVGLVNCTHMAVKNLSLTNKNKQDVLLAFTTNSTITGNSISRNSRGIELYSSSNNTIFGNNITNNYDGIKLSLSSNNVISANSLTYNYDGIFIMSSSSRNNVSGNNMTNNRRGILIVDSSKNRISRNNIAKSENYGIGLYWHSNYNTISRNNITRNSEYGMWLYDSSNTNTIYGNNIAENNEYGILLYLSSNSIIYHNNFVDNTEQVYSASSTNVWDNGYPSGGNYWSDYNAVDGKSGPDQDQPRGDGISDISYTINGNNRDNYPLLNPWTPVDAIPPVIHIFSPQNKTYGATFVRLTLTVCDPIHASPIFWIGYSLDSQVNVTISENTTLTDLSCGVHNITVHAHDTFGNMGRSDTIYFAILPGDLNDDGKVDIEDLVLFIKAFGTNPSHPRWKPEADLNNDNKADIIDLVLLIKNFGKHT